MKMHIHNKSMAVVNITTRSYNTSDALYCLHAGLKYLLDCFDMQ